jgi:hypothetical protein
MDTGAAAWDGRYGFFEDAVVEVLPMPCPAADDFGDDVPGMMILLGSLGDLRQAGSSKARRHGNVGDME